MVESQPWELRYTKQALKDAKKLSSANYDYLTGSDIIIPQERKGKQI